MSEQHPDAAWPDVDVVMPIRNEALHLETAIESVRRQAYPGRLRILLGVGPSTDGTEALADRLAADSDDLTVVANPSGRTPSALNAAIRAGSAPVIVRVDGHSELSAGYVRRAVEILRDDGRRERRRDPTTGADHAVRAGGRRRDDVVARHRRCVLPARSTAGAVDTVYLGRVRSGTRSKRSGSSTSS